MLLALNACCTLCACGYCTVVIAHNYVHNMAFIIHRTHYEYHFRVYLDTHTSWLRLFHKQYEVKHMKEIKELNVMTRWPVRANNNSSEGIPTKMESV